MLGAIWAKSYVTQKGIVQIYALRLNTEAGLSCDAEGSYKP